MRRLRDFTFQCDTMCLYSNANTRKQEEDKM
jgi:hypothetical protein